VRVSRILYVDRSDTLIYNTDVYVYMLVYMYIYIYTYTYIFVYTFFHPYMHYILKRSFLQALTKNSVVLGLFCKRVLLFCGSLAKEP